MKPDTPSLKTVKIRNPFHGTQKIIDVSNLGDPCEGKFSDGRDKSWKHMDISSQMIREKCHSLVTSDRPDMRQVTPFFFLKYFVIFYILDGKIP